MTTYNPSHHALSILGSFAAQVIVILLGTTVAFSVFVLDVEEADGGVCHEIQEEIHSPDELAVLEEELTEIYRTQDRARLWFEIVLFIALFCLLLTPLSAAKHWRKIRKRSQSNNRTRTVTGIGLLLLAAGIVAALLVDAVETSTNEHRERFVISSKDATVWSNVRREREKAIIEMRDLARRIAAELDSEEVKALKERRSGLYVKRRAADMRLRDRESERSKRVMAYSMQKQPSNSWAKPLLFPAVWCVVVGWWITLSSSRNNELAVK